MEPYLDVGIHMLFLSISASAAQGYVAEDRSRVFSAVLAGAGVVLFPGRIRLRLGGCTGPGLQREHAKMVGKEVAGWGEWLTAGSATVEIRID